MVVRFLFLALALVACRRDRPFTTLATYEAPKSGFRLIVDATGVVPADEDLAPAVPVVAIVCPKSTGHPLRIDVTGWTAVVTDGSTTTSVKWNAPSFTRALADAGYPSPDYVEIDEALGAIGGVAAGPKGTHMPGQTRAIGVVKVDFSGHAPANVSQCP